ncbi:hypothetical protein CRUP_035286 [Coryphaenoides rupestris]|nr:hypothetical protein CRUP_035286 [Coryphaenoides rupestris]
MDSQSWKESRMFCVASGADLVVINRKEELDFISNHIERLDYWLGATDKVNEGMWGWVDGTVLLVDNPFWSRGQPGIDQNCLEINGYFEQNQYEWPGGLGTWDGPKFVPQQSLQVVCVLVPGAVVGRAAHPEGLEQRSQPLAESAQALQHSQLQLMGPARALAGACWASEELSLGSTSLDTLLRRKSPQASPRVHSTWEQTDWNLINYGKFFQSSSGKVPGILEGGGGRNCRTSRAVMSARFGTELSSRPDGGPPGLPRLGGNHLTGSVARAGQGRGGEVQGQQHVLHDVPHQREQAGVRVGQDHRQHLGGLGARDTLWKELIGRGLALANQGTRPALPDYPAVSLEPVQVQETYVEQPHAPATPRAHAQRRLAHPASASSPAFSSNGGTEGGAQRRGRRTPHALSWMHSCQMLLWSCWTGVEAAPFAPH